LRRAVARPTYQTSGQTQQRRGGSRPQATGRVYAMTGSEAAGSGNLVVGCCVISGKSCCVLFDSGATLFCVGVLCAGVRSAGV